MRFANSMLSSNIQHSKCTVWYLRKVGAAPTGYAKHSNAGDRPVHVFVDAEFYKDSYRLFLRSNRKNMIVMTSASSTINGIMHTNRLQCIPRGFFAIPIRHFPS